MSSLWVFLGPLQFPVVCPAALIPIPRKAKLAQWSVGAEDSGARLPGFKSISH